MSNQPVFLRERPEQDPLVAMNRLKAPPPEPVAQQQSGLTLMAQIEDGKVDEVRALLTSISLHLADERPPPGAPHIRFGDLTTTHFCRFVLIPADPTHGAPASLAFESNYDGDL